MLNRILLKSKLGDSSEAVALKKQIGDLTEKELFHINVYKLADQAGINRKTYLDLFLTGVFKGIFSLQWEYHCPMCGGVARENLSLKESQATDHCSLCNIDFQNTLNRNIEVFFNPTGDLAVLPEKYAREYGAVIGERLASESKYEWINEYTIYGVDCIQSRIFRELIKDELLPASSSLQIERATLLFTDIKGSTRMYEELGDAKAFRLVRDHFNILFDAIQDKGGVPIKTIGDAVMGVFMRSADSLAAAFEMLVQLDDYNRNQPDNQKLELKIGMHTGTTIVVTLNDRLDYFGSTVNRAARAQSKAGPREIILTEEVFKDPATVKWLSAKTKKVWRGQVQFKGVEETQTIYRIKYGLL
jgi:class 3 adenylate cyclase